MTSTPLPSGSGLPDVTWLKADGPVVACSSFVVRRICPPPLRWDCDAFETAVSGNAAGAQSGGGETAFANALLPCTLLGLGCRDADEA